MKVKLEKQVFGPNRPQSGDIGEALYYRYEDNNEHNDALGPEGVDSLWLYVLFYGFPGTYRVRPEWCRPLNRECSQPTLEDVRIVTSCEQHGG